ncbi:MULTISPECIES: efflux RND transporter periplasmic adaptor subunit [Candidatus Accumulibacter]|uniref:Efflux RND transporter periplasmic adaptor subunit n=4 Tax=Candidatus Accumulibacter TaxID=327159 RepID=A0A080M0Q9_9PROT|nr:MULTISPECIES: efflux RND transporter periplasmic adaptor subunit [Candidatus Accumulibacter]KFB74788.1 MAG: Macrolide-specific efflux protein MacA precursor [Candidatus Accumulibacter cognatus]MBN8518585.1 efflux RND transporter periplasmic adaptor subunit [Accumulibacter sp.]QLH48913.1 MAG: efflux RND transporter periplasmic adaptor subunit [Candidatus Accumulibacter cognatus]TMQ75110.1 Acriflavin resistance protein [Candidatus Accumulibacter phosphatis]
MAEPDKTPASPLSLLAIDRNAAPTRRRRRRWAVWLAAVLGIGGIAAYLLVPGRVDVQVTTVLSAYPSQQYTQLTASGYVVAQRRASVASKGTGRLVELRVREGSPVQAGELIGRLDASDVRAALRVAEAAIGQAAAGLRQAEANLEQARAEAANAEVEFQRQQALRARGFVSSQAVDAAQRRALAARAGVGAGRAAIDSARAAVALAQAQVAVQQVNQDNTDIRAPFDGVVLVKNANVGDMITPFSAAAGTSGAVVTMADMSTLEVEADVSESHVARVRVDMPVEITLDAIPDARFRGSVARVVPTVDRAKATVVTKIRFDRIDARILPEMSAKVNFLSQPATDADQTPVVAVNPRAIAERAGSKVVFRLLGETVEALPVTLGRKLGDAQELTGSPLQPGERLVLAPPERLAAGAQVVVSGGSAAKRSP